MRCRSIDLRIRRAGAPTGCGEVFRLDECYHAFDLEYGGYPMTRLFALAVFAAALIGPNAVHATSRLRHTPTSPDHVAWVTVALNTMQTIQTDMTLDDLISVFTTHAGS